MNNGYFLTVFFMNHTFCVLVRIASVRRFLQISKTYVFPKELQRTVNEKIHNPLISAQTKIDFITNFAVITNVIIKRVHCILHLRTSLVTSNLFPREKKNTLNINRSDPNGKTFAPM